jgi:hypothetical protein
MAQKPGLVTGTRDGHMLTAICPNWAVCDRMVCHRMVFNRMACNRPITESGCTQTHCTKRYLSLVTSVEKLSAEEW